VPGIIKVVEAHKICTQYALQELASDWEHSIDFGSGERCVEEEAAGDIVQEALPEQRWEHHQVVVIHKHQITLRLGPECIKC
jgi:hypothetical protein